MKSIGQIIDEMVRSGKLPPILKEPVGSSKKQLELNLHVARSGDPDHCLERKPRKEKQ